MDPREFNGRPYDHNAMEVAIAGIGLPKEIGTSYSKMGISGLYEWQSDCIRRSQGLQGNLVYCAPTSGGKTLIAELVILKTVILRRKKSIFVLPFVSLVLEKEKYFVSKLLRRYNRSVSKEHRVTCKGYYGDQVANSRRGLKENIIICTIEKANAIVNSYIARGQGDKIGCVVIDELHTLGDAFNGYLLEILVSKLKFLEVKMNAALSQMSQNLVSPFQMQLVGMSATVGNIKALADWFGAQLYVTDFRPVPLVEYIKAGNDVVGKDGQCIRNLPPDKAPPLPGSNKESTPSLLSLYAPSMAHSWNIQTLMAKPIDHLSYLTMEALSGGQQVLIFCPAKYMCESTCKSLLACFTVYAMNSTAAVTHMAGATSEALADDRGRLIEEIDGVDQAEAKQGPSNHVTPHSTALRAAILRGVAFHHSSLSSAERRAVEKGFRTGAISVIVSTSTLAAGVNLPAGRVLIRSLSIGRSVLSAAQYRQMSGRAGRAGQHSAYGESFLVVEHFERPKALALVNAPIADVKSQIHPKHDGGRAVLRALLEMFTLDLCNSVSDVMDYAKFTLMYHENKVADSFDTLGGQIDESVLSICSDCLDFLMSSKAIAPRDGILSDQAKENAENAGIELIASQRQASTAPIKISRFGRAIAQSGLNPDEAIIVYRDLLRAQAGVNLEDNLHVLFLVAPIDHNIQPDFAALVKWFDRGRDRLTQQNRGGGATGSSSSASRAFAGSALGLEEEVYAYLVRWSSSSPPSKTALDSCVDTYRRLSLQNIAYNRTGGSIERSKPGAAMNKDPLFWETLCRCKRLWGAMLLRDALAGEPLEKIIKVYNTDFPHVEDLQRNVCMMAAKVQKLCAELGWSPLERLVNYFKTHKLVFQRVGGADAKSRELLALPRMNSKLAEALIEKGVGSVADLAAQNPSDLAAYLQLKSGFEMKSVKTGLATDPQAMDGPSREETQRRVLQDFLAKIIASAKEITASKMDAIDAKVSDLMGVLADSSRSTGDENIARGAIRGGGSDDDILSDSSEEGVGDDELNLLDEFAELNLCSEGEDDDDEAAMMTFGNFSRAAWMPEVPTNITNNSNTRENDSAPSSSTAEVPSSFAAVASSSALSQASHAPNEKSEIALKPSGPTGTGHHLKRKLLLLRIDPADCNDAGFYAPDQSTQSSQDTLGCVSDGLVNLKFTRGDSDVRGSIQTSPQVGAVDEMPIKIARLLEIEEEDTGTDMYAVDSEDEGVAVRSDNDLATARFLPSSFRPSVPTSVASLKAGCPIILNFNDVILESPTSPESVPSQSIRPSSLSPGDLALIELAEKCKAEGLFQNKPSYARSTASSNNNAISLQMTTVNQYEHQPGKRQQQPQKGDDTDVGLLLLSPGEMKLMALGEACDREGLFEPKKKAGVPHVSAPLQSAHSTASSNFLSPDAISRASSPFTGEISQSHRRLSFASAMASSQEHDSSFTVPEQRLSLLDAPKGATSPSESQQLELARCIVGEKVAQRNYIASSCMMDLSEEAPLIIEENRAESRILRQRESFGVDNHMIEDIDPKDHCDEANGDQEDDILGDGAPLPSPYLTPFTPSKLKHTPGHYLYLPCLLPLTSDPEEAAGEPTLTERFQTSAIIVSPSIDVAAASQSSLVAHDDQVIPKEDSSALLLTTGAEKAVAACSGRGFGWRHLSNAVHCRAFLQQLVSSTCFSFELHFRRIPKVAMKDKDKWRGLVSWFCSEHSSETFGGVSSHAALGTDGGARRTGMWDPHVIAGVAFCFGDQYGYYLPLPCPLPLIKEQQSAVVDENEQGSRHVQPSSTSKGSASTLGQLPLLLKQLICRFVGFGRMLGRCRYLKERVRGVARSSAETSCSSDLLGEELPNSLLGTSREWSRIARQSMAIEWRKGACIEWKLLSELMFDESITKVAVDMQGKLAALRERDVLVRGRIEDPSLAVALLNSSVFNWMSDESITSTTAGAKGPNQGKKKSPSLSAIRVNVNALLYPAMPLVDDSKPTSRHVEYQRVACFRSIGVMRAMAQLGPILRAHRVFEIFHRIEMPLLYTTADVEFYGLPIDSNFFTYLSEIVDDRLRTIENLFERLFKMRLLRQQINIAAPGDLSKLRTHLIDAFIEKRKNESDWRGKSDVEIKSLADTAMKSHPLLAAGSEYNYLTRSLSPLCHSVLHRSDAGRVRAKVNTLGTDTGRVIVSEPPLQMVPKNEIALLKSCRPLFHEEIKFQASMYDLDIDRSQRVRMAADHFNRSAAAGGQGQPIFLRARSLQHPHDVPESNRLFGGNPNAKLNRRSRLRSKEPYMKCKLVQILNATIDKQYPLDATLSISNGPAPAASRSASSDLSLAYLWRQAGVPYSAEQAAEVLQVMVEPVDNGNDGHGDTRLRRQYKKYCYPADQLYRIDAANNPDSREVDVMREALNKGVWSSEPFLAASQPEDKVLTVNPRDGFIASKGFVLLAADYSQIELRIMAHFSNDKNLCAAFRSGDDVFRQIAAVWKKKAEPAGVTKAERDAVKQLCYANIYGSGPQLIAEKMNVSHQEASRMMTEFLNRYPGLLVFMKAVKARCRGCGFVETILGRRRAIPGIRSGDKKECSKAERQAVNTVCQGSAADLIKLAMINITHRLSELSASSVINRRGRTTASDVTVRATPSARHHAVVEEDEGTSGEMVEEFYHRHSRSFPGANLYDRFDDARLVLQVHDEIILEVREEHVIMVARVVKECMESAVKLQVPLEVKLQVGSSWGSLQSLELATSKGDNE